MVTKHEDVALTTLLIVACVLALVLSVTGLLW